MNTDIYNVLIKYRLSPNQLYLIHSLSEGIVPADIINVKAEGNICRMLGLIDEDNRLTDAAKGVLVEVNNVVGKAKRKVQKTLLGKEHDTYITMYRDLWPKGNLPSGKPARLSIPDLRKKFTDFFKEHDYEWSTIINATKEYIRQKEHSPYMMTSGYFILKNDQSELASYCELVLDPSFVNTNSVDLYTHFSAL